MDKSTLGVATAGLILLLGLSGCANRTIRRSAPSAAGCSARAPAPRSARRPAAVAGLLSAPRSAAGPARSAASPPRRRHRAIIRVRATTRRRRTIRRRDIIRRLGLSATADILLLPVKAATGPAARSAVALPHPTRVCRRPGRRRLRLCTAWPAGLCGGHAPDGGSGPRKHTTATERLRSFPLRHAPVAAPARDPLERSSRPVHRSKKRSDLAVALGLVDAHLRLAQMEALRRIAQGRLAEMLGARRWPLYRTVHAIDIGRAVPAIVEIAGPHPRLARRLCRSGSITTSLTLLPGASRRLNSACWA